MELDWTDKIILVAEDEPANYLFIQKILASTHVTLIRAKNGVEAVEIIKDNNDIDILLTDIYMPEMDGFMAAKIIKELKPDLPIIAQTFYESELDKEKVKNACFDSFISKPININKLLVVLDKYLG